MVTVRASLLTKKGKQPRGHVAELESRGGVADAVGGARVELQRRGAGGAERAVLGGPPLERARHRTADAQGGERVDALRRLLRRLQLEQVKG